MSSPREPARPQRADPLSVREGRRSLGLPHEGVPAHLEGPPRSWLRGYLLRELQQRVALQLEVELAPRALTARTVAPPQELALHPDVDLLDVTDVAIRLDEDLAPQVQDLRRQLAGGPTVPGLAHGRAEEVAGLGQLLDDANSVYKLHVNEEGHARLMRRVDPTVQAAAEEAIATADPTAGDLLRKAWTAAYSRSPDSDSAYLDAIRAVETLACPLVLPNSSRATLRSVVKHLRAAPQKWELTLTKLGDGTVEPLVEMFDRLWHGNLASRHGSLDYREVTLDEARAAVHLAVTCVQWLTDDVLRPRTTPGRP